LLTVLTSPATAARASLGGTAFLCIENPDPTAANVKHLLKEAGLRPKDMVPWNARPRGTEHERVSAAISRSHPTLASRLAGTGFVAQPSKMLIA
jgi:hypothetical protein